MSWLLSFCGIYPDAIENIDDKITEELKKVGIDFEVTDSELEYELEQVGDWKDITNSIVLAFCSIGASMVYRRYPNAKIEWDVNGDVSDFTIENIDELLNESEDDRLFKEMFGDLVKEDSNKYSNDANLIAFENNVYLNDDNALTEFYFYIKRDYVEKWLKENDYDMNIDEFHDCEYTSDDSNSLLENGILNNFVVAIIKH